MSNTKNKDLGKIGLVKKTIFVKEIEHDPYDYDDFINDEQLMCNE